MSIYSDRGGVVLSTVDQGSWSLVTEEVKDDDVTLTYGLNGAGDYIGDEKTSRFLIEERGLAPEVSRDEHHNHSVCSIGFCEADQKWYGWSHRAIFGFGIGDVTKEGDCSTESGWTSEYLESHPEKDRRVPVGFEVKTLDDAKLCAIAFADSVS